MPVFDSVTKAPAGRGQGESLPIQPAGRYAAGPVAAKDLLGDLQHTDPVLRDVVEEHAVAIGR